MKNKTISIDCCGEQLLLHPGKVVYWPAQKTLLAADIHVGKEHTFSRAGIPIPGGVSERTLDRLLHLSDEFAAERLLILGDLLHAKPADSEPWQAHLVALLAARSSLSVQVVIGNHDSKGARDKVQAKLDWVESLYEPPFFFAHEPADIQDKYVMAGHIHPVHRLKAGKQSVRAPVFWFRERYAVLPSFGDFTGGHPIEPESTDRVYLIADEELFELPA